MEARAHHVVMRAERTRTTEAGVPQRRTDYRRSFLVFADALERAADDKAAHEALMRTLVERRGEIAAPATLQALRCLVGLLCVQTGATPRSILDAEFQYAPADEAWRAVEARV